MGTKFTIYDHGINPVKAQGLVEKAHTRQELAAVCYVSDLRLRTEGRGMADCMLQIFLLYFFVLYHME